MDIVKRYGGTGVLIPVLVLLVVVLFKVMWLSFHSPCNFFKNPFFERISLKIIT